VAITLADCLACSGCITSAETVLVEAQSAAKLYTIFQVIPAGLV
jgi:iron only hydrogenase large subunit-like protein